MGRDINDDRRRALVKGKFKFLYQDDTEDIEASDKFTLSVVQNKLLGPVKYVDKDGKDQEVLKIYGQERKEGEGFANPDTKIPGVLDFFTVVWSNPFGDISVEQDIKLFEFSDIQKYSTYNDGPESRDFCRFYTSSSSRDFDGFDSSIFWSVGFLWKHFRTCGVEAWDLQLKELVEHYKNWRAWTHEVHNLPGSGSSRKYSDNVYSAPARASTSYTRDKDQQNNNTSTSCKVNTPPPPAAVVPPPPGQTVMVPVPCHDGNIVHVQLSTVLPPVLTPGPPSKPRYKYINPTVPPPGYKDSKTGQAGQSAKATNSTWSSQVDDFLLRPSPRKSKRKFDSDSEPEKAKRSSFTPKAPIFAPCPSSHSSWHDNKKIYLGEISDWRGKFGFMNCCQIPGKIFVHSKDILSGRKGVKAGTKVQFQVLHQDSSLVGAKAVNVSVRS